VRLRFPACGGCAGGAARASRTKSEISCIQGMLVCFDLDPSSHSLRRVKAQALRGNTQAFPSCRGSFERKPSLRPNNPRLEARFLISAIADHHRVRSRCAVAGTLSNASPLPFLCQARSSTPAPLHQRSYRLHSAEERRRQKVRALASVRGFLDEVCLKRVARHIGICNQAHQ